MNRRKVNAVLATIALLGAGTSPWIVHAEETPGAEVTTADPPASADDSATVWDKTRGVSGDAWEASKEGSARAWDKTKEVSGDAWDATKEGSARAWDKTKEVSGDVWDATKEGSARAWDKTREISGDAWDAAKEGSARAWDETGDVVQGEPQTAPGSEADANQDPPATPSPSS